MQNILKLLLLVLITSGVGVPSYYITVEREQPPFEQVQTTDQKKLLLAKELSSWAANTLKKQQISVAVIARKGGADIQQHDITGMAHSGLVIYDFRSGEYIVYNLVNGANGTSRKTSGIYRTKLIDFYYGQTGYSRDAVILVPNSSLQHKIQRAISNGQYKKLFFTNKYNLLSQYHSTESLNCNKWVLMNLYAAITNNYGYLPVLNYIKENFKLKPIVFSPTERQFMESKDNVVKEELGNSQEIYTVTVESLYLDKQLFPKNIFSQNTKNK